MRGIKILHHNGNTYKKFNIYKHFNFQAVQKNNLLVEEPILLDFNLKYNKSMESFLGNTEKSYFLLRNDIY